MVPQPIGISVKSANTFLSMFGDGLYNKPRFRVVWSNEQLEKRYGTFTVYSESGLYLRTETGVKEVPKYYNIKDRWIVEQWFPPELIYTEELPDSKSGSYECIYVFEDKVGRPLPIEMKVLEVLIHAVMKRPRSSMLIKSEEQSRREDQERKQQKEDEDFLECSPITNALHLKEGIGYTKELKNVTNDKPSN